VAISAEAQNCVKAFGLKATSPIPETIIAPKLPEATLTADGMAFRTIDVNPMIIRATRYNVAIAK